ncbi:hypothetical protein ACFXJ8_43850 [Nonomuraea sp. NPDC059194]|uniref:hypothetical protein n=1 Tax=Nonomuraea sp. NPDC059194 TaxID=3346764 RepID=UPI003685DD7D
MHVASATEVRAATCTVWPTPSTSKNLGGIMPTVEEVLAGLGKLGGPETEPHYPMGWAWAGNTPFQWVKV